MRSRLRSVIVAGTVGFAGGLASSGNAAFADGSRWSGAYAGISIGYGWESTDATFTGNDPAMNFALIGLAGSPITSANVDSKGALGGVTIGYNWQVQRSWLLGAEVDFNWSDLDGKGCTTCRIIGPLTTTVGVRQEIDWFGTVRGRLGWLPTEQLLLYATGGLAYGRVQESAELSLNFVGAPALGGFSFSCTTANVPCVVGSSSRTGIGWTLGGGAEYALTSNISIKTEYLYVNIGHENLTSTALATAAAPNANRSSFTTHFGDVEVHTVKAGLNLKF